MIYLVYSKESEMARRTALKIVKEHYPKRDEGNFISLNMAVTPVATLVDECNAFSLMAEKKGIFAENCAFLAKEGKGKKTKDKDLLELASYCEHPNEEIDLFLVVYAKELDEKSPIVQAISKTGFTKEVPVPSEEEWISYAKRSLAKAGASIDDDAARELVKRIDGNYGRFLAELSKLDAYANNGRISVEDIRLLVTPKEEDDTFQLSNALIRGDIESALKIYYDLKKHSIEEISLMNMLASQFRFLDQVQYLYSNGMNKFDIAKQLGASPYRVEICIKNLRGMKAHTNKRILERLYRTEKAVLTGSQNGEFAFTLFLSKTTV